MSPSPRVARIDSFDFQPGRVLARKYEVVAKLGEGWEGEVYLIREKGTGIERAAKFFFPQRNVANRSVNFHAKKLHKLRDCPALIQYHTHETIRFKGHEISFLISDYVEGEVLPDFLSRQPGGRLDAFQGLHLLHSFARAVEDIHDLGEYHGDLHSGNVIVRRYGLGFQIKLLDFFHWGSSRPENLREDILDVIKIFYEVLGGSARYAKLPQEVKDVIRGRKRNLVLKKFRTIRQLRRHLETIEWSSEAISR